METAVFIAATVTTGMMAGLFYAYSISVMPALRGADAAVLVEVMQRINRAITNGWFALCFVGALLFTALAAVLEPSVPVLIGLVLYAAQLALTFGLHIPLNNRLEAAGNGNPEAAREFFEAKWVRWNHVRTLLCTGAFGSLCGALTQI